MSSQPRSNPTQTDDQHPKRDSEELIELKDILLHQERLRVKGLEEENARLQGEVDRLEEELAEARAEVIPKITNNFSDITRDAVLNQNADMAEALFPVIGPAVIRAVEDALEQLRDNINRQINRNSSNPINSTISRLQGVDPAQRAIAGSAPFEIRHLFLIQRDSGLVIDFINQDASDEFSDSDLVSSMLTAIRSFMRDSFNPESDSDEGLREIKHDDDTIHLESGTEAYIAAVVNGIEPEGFTYFLKRLVSDLHNRHHDQLANYNGSQESAVVIRPTLQGFLDSYASDSPPTISSGPSEESSQNMLKWVAIALSVFGIISCCFYTWFTYTLFPAAWAATFGPPVPTQIILPTPTETLIPPTATEVVLPTATQTALPTATETPSPTAEPTETSTPEPTTTSTPEPTATFTAEPTATPTQIITPTPSVGRIVTQVNLWSRRNPDFSEPVYRSIPLGTEVILLDRIENWVKIGWEDFVDGSIEGWVPEDWLNEES